MDNTKDIKVFDGLPFVAGFTTKEGGLKSDEKRNGFAAEMKELGGRVIRPRLVHGSRIQVVDREFLASYGDETVIEVPETDGCVTDIPNVVLTSTHGDCTPVYACDPVKKVAGLAHAGWRGTLAGISHELIQTMINNYGCDPEDIRVYVGPAIGACCFEVGEEVAEQFADKFFYNEEIIYAKPDGKYLLDIKAVSAQLALMDGVRQLEISNLCTFCEENLFWSYRRAKDSDRMLAYIYII